MFIERMEELNGCINRCSITTHKESIDHEEALRLAGELATKGEVFVIGNGGSAGIASHFANDLLKTLKQPASTLTDSNSVTCFGNDYGYEYIFSGPLEVRMQKQDVLVAISSSGQSPNILNACKVAQNKGSKILTLSGFLENNPLRQMGDLNFWIDVEDYGLVETAHFFLLHTIIDSLSSCKRRSEELMKLATL